MGFTNARQLQELFLSCGMGFLLGAYYDVFRFWRKTVRSSTVVVVLQDCLFFSTSAVVIFLFSLAMTEGVVRFYVLLGSAIGFWAYRRTVGNALLRTVEMIQRWVKRTYDGVCRLLCIPISYINSMLHKVCGKVWEKCRKITKKCKEIFKKVLQPVRKLLYNHRV